LDLDREQTDENENPDLFLPDRYHCLHWLCRFNQPESGTSEASGGIDAP
jgi:hypothetical protein